MTEYIFVFQSTIKLQNPHLQEMEEDYLYHLGLGTKTHNLPEMFGDVKVKKKTKYHPNNSTRVGLLLFNTMKISLYKNMHLIIFKH